MTEKIKKDKDVKKQNVGKSQKELSVSEMRDIVLSYIGQNTKHNTEKYKKKDMIDKKQLERIISRTIKSEMSQKAVNIKDKDKLLVKKIVNSYKNKKTPRHKKFAPRENSLQGKLAIGGRNVVSAQVKKQEIKSRKFFSKKRVFIIIVLFFLLALFFILVFCKKDINNKHIKKFSPELSKTKMRVNDVTIEISEYNNNLNGFSRLYKNYNFDANMFEKYIADMLARNKILEEIIKEKNIEVDLSKIDYIMQEEIYKRDSSFEDANMLIEKLFGWDMEEYKKNIIRPLVLRDALQCWIASNTDINGIVLKKAKAINEKLKEIISTEGNSSEVFGKLANYYNEDKSVAFDGSLGFIKKGDIVKEVEAKMFNMGIGEVSNLVKSKYGYHIIRINDKIEDEEIGEDVINGQHILVKFKSADQYIEEKIVKSDIRYIMQ
ncbi:peptidylprolyl isomerase [Patescibacteria group bacterium]